jgi:hypothetical protein
MKKIKKLMGQIRILKNQIRTGQQENLNEILIKIESLQNEIKKEKELLDIIAENNYWERYASY